MKYAIAASAVFALLSNAALANSCEEAIRARITLNNCPKIQASATKKCQDSYEKRGMGRKHHLEACPHYKENATRTCIERYIRRDCGGGKHKHSGKKK